MAELAVEGIGKSRNNVSQGYKFRGIDDVYNALAEKMVKHGLLMLPSYDGHVVAERGQTKAGAQIYGATVVGHFDLVSTKDGSAHRITVMGEAADQADKATNKAMSAAYKYACIQAFCIPTEGDNDADATTHEVAPARAIGRPAAKPETKPTAEQETRAMDWIASFDECMNLDDLKRKFEQAFHDVAEHFAGLFTTLFPGGSGRISLMEPDDLLNTGIEIEARPSGKNVRRLSLLSGGERSLTALAYLFAVFRARPSPFYLLDEVEAALDDVNLHRFLDLVHEFRDEAQLVIVTHQKRTMEAADILYGVSMPPGGSTRVVSQRAHDVFVTA